MSVREYILVPLERWKQLKSHQESKTEIAYETCANKQSEVPSSTEKEKNMVPKGYKDNTENTSKTWIQY